MFICHKHFDYYNFINLHNFSKISFEKDCDINRVIDKVKNCRKLYFPNTNITNKDLENLQNCHTLDLSCTKIIDE